jgi:4-amino-4-deoxy-L-arabinose transferase-like glycosyltransferase
MTTSYATQKQSKPTSKNRRRGKAGVLFPSTLHGKDIIPLTMASKHQNIFSTPIEKLRARDSLPGPFPFFSAVVLSNLFLSYFNLSLTVSFWIILVGILLPLALASLLAQTRKGPQTAETLPSIPLWIWVLLGAASVFFRLYRLTTLSSWPIVDEGIFGYFATRLEENWNWQLVHCFAQEPILYTWGQWLFFKLFGNSLSSLWLFPALCSIACLPAAWLLGHRALGRSAGFIAACWMALGFWPLYMGRFSVQSILMVLWECLALLALASCLSLSPKAPDKKPFLWLAFLTGTGFYIYLAWPMVAALVSAALLLNPGQTWSKRLKQFFLFLIPTSAIALPLALLFAKNYLGYFGHLWSPNSSVDWGARLLLPLAYAKGLFWGTHQQVFSYGPLWGGLLNPLLAGFFFWGLAILLRSYRKPLTLWIVAALALFSLPAVMTNNFEMMRFTALLPVLIGIATLGTRSLLSYFPAAKRLWIFLLLLGFSSALDLYHLFIVYPQIQARNPAYYGAHKTPEFAKAYPLLKVQEAQLGPGLILLNFNPDPYDQTLFTASYSFNAAENSHLYPSGAQWAALLVNVHEQPYLQKLFPKGRWVWLSEGLNRQDGGFLLEIVPVENDNRGLLLKWTKADGSLSELTRLVMELGVDPDQRQMQEVLDKAYPFFKGDHLLESHFWRIRAIHSSAAGQVAQAVEDEKVAIRSGYPMAHLYNELGCLLYKENRLIESRKAFEEAACLKPNCTAAAVNLQNLIALEKTKTN